MGRRSLSTTMRGMQRREDERRHRRRRTVQVVSSRCAMAAARWCVRGVCLLMLHLLLFLSVSVCSADVTVAAAAAAAAAVNADERRLRGGEESGQRSAQCSSACVHGRRRLYDGRE